METKKYVIKVTRFFTCYKEYFYFGDGDPLIFSDLLGAATFCDEQLDKPYQLDPLELRRPSYIPVLWKNQNQKQ